MLRLVRRHSEKLSSPTLVWDGSLNDGKKRGDHPYYCPNGWQKYGLMIAGYETAQVCKNHNKSKMFLSFCVSERNSTKSMMDGRLCITARFMKTHI